jgi:hypothetical protein
MSEVCPLKSQGELLGESGVLRQEDVSWVGGGRDTMQQ